jgi:hypothetical protein
MELNFEKKNNYIHFKITGEYKESEDIDKIKDLCIIPKENGYSTILVDVRGLKYELDTIKRFDLSKHWVKLCRELHFITAAILGNEEKMDEFSENVISNRGGNFKLFTDEKEAVDWLRRFNK